jgi:hypothetical protein
LNRLAGACIYAGPNRAIGAPFRWARDIASFMLRRRIEIAVGWLRRLTVKG